MKTILLLISLTIGVCLAGWAQVVTTSPVIPRAGEPLTITVDVTGTSLEGYDWNNVSSPIWIWTWIEEGCTVDCDAPTNVDPAGAGQEAAKVTRTSTDPDVYEITFTPTEFFNKAASEIKRIGFKLKTTAWSENRQTDVDRFINFYDGYTVLILQPSEEPLFMDTGEQMKILAEASEQSDFIISINGSPVATVDDQISLSYLHSVEESEGTAEVVVSATNGTETREESFTYIVRKNTTEQARPSNVIDGINYHDDPSTVTLSLWAPGKSSVYVLGDFSNWQVLSQYQMKRDGEHFWIEIGGLTPGQEYGFQYLVDETLRVADPYAEKILDPDDQFIPDAIYPGLKPFPAEARSDRSYFNRVAVLQTQQTPYVWKIEHFEKPQKKDLVIYELLIRDFFSSDERSYQNLIDTIGYFKRLGVNAIQLMPIMEFNGNDSWGYNPVFMFAPDKYYGPKNKLKEFIDRCHENGLAVILDIALNHQDMPNPYLLMEFDFTKSKPRPGNPWFNVAATHPFNVFYDMNHESPYTQAYMDTINYYWLTEFKADGFRFDLSKGFTQQNNPDDVNAWSAYDASRIALLKRMADKIWSYAPDAYVILEHLAVNEEEKELAEYRMDEGKGMMLWGNMNGAYSQLVKGNPADISDTFYQSKGWNVPNLIAYMESHDEERLMYEALEHGKAGTAYNIRDFETATARIKAAALCFYTIPGPRMLWQFGEMGYDESINRCPDGSVHNDCRVAAKPVKWEYLTDAPTASLFDHVRSLIQLRRMYTVFTEGDATVSNGTSLAKSIVLKNTPYTPSPQRPSEMNVVVIANFDVEPQAVSVTFPHAGIWYDYFDVQHPLNVRTVSYNVNLGPGEYKLLTDYNLKGSPVTSIARSAAAPLRVYPNPTTGKIRFSEEVNKPVKIQLFDHLGKMQVVENEGAFIDVSHLSDGIYFLMLDDGTTRKAAKIIKQ